MSAEEFRKVFRNLSRRLCLFGPHSGMIVVLAKAVRIGLSGVKFDFRLKCLKDVSILVQDHRSNLNDRMSFGIEPTCFQVKEYKSFFHSR